MAAITGPEVAAPVGSTGGNTHDSVYIGPATQVGLDFNVESVGATPTVTLQIQGSFDNTNWSGNLAIVNRTVTASSTATVTATGHTHYWVSAQLFFPYYRLVTSSNTNVTYDANFYATV